MSMMRVDLSFTDLKSSLSSSTYEVSRSDKGFAIGKNQSPVPASDGFIFDAIIVSGLMKLKRTVSASDVAG